MFHAVCMGPIQPPILPAFTLHSPPFHASQVVGIAQLIFFQGDEGPEVTYADRQGKYMDQRGVTLPRL